MKKKRKSADKIVKAPLRRNYSISELIDLGRRKNTINIADILGDIKIKK